MVSESTRVNLPSPKCSRGSTDDSKPRVGCCSRNWVSPCVFTITFAPMPVVFFPAPCSATVKYEFPFCSRA